MAALYTGLERAGVMVWLVGGWGVDALLGVQTLEHSDLDLVVQEKDLPRLRSYLIALGFRDVARDDTRPWNFVLANPAEEAVDLQVINIDDAGDGIQGPRENGEIYPAAALLGKGSIDSIPVRCISAAYQLVFHTGYRLRPVYHQDVHALTEAFGLKLPIEYQSQESPPHRT